MVVQNFYKYLEWVANFLSVPDVMMSVFCGFAPIMFFMPKKLGRILFCIRDVMLLVLYGRTNIMI